jgi:hypothetical protein
MGKLLLGVATLALSAGAASAQVVYPSYSYAPYGYGYYSYAPYGYGYYSYAPYGYGYYSYAATAPLYNYYAPGYWGRYGYWWR